MSQDSILHYLNRSQVMNQLQFSTSSPTQCSLDGGASFDPGAPLPLAEGAKSSTGGLALPGTSAPAPRGPAHDHVTSGGDPFSFVEAVRAELETGVEHRGGALAGGDGPVRFGAAAVAVHRAGGIPVSVHGEAALGQVEAQLAFDLFGQRIEVESSASVLSADAAAGIVNPDGSLGFNLGASANLAAAEITLRHGAEEITIGSGEGVGAGFSIGLRDRNGNGIPELCGRSDVAIVAGLSLGGCTEVTNLIPVPGVAAAVQAARVVQGLIERE